MILLIGGKIMRNFVKILLCCVCVITVTLSFFGCSKEIVSTPVDAKDFRVTAYVVGGSLNENFDYTNLERVTDVIFFGCADFDENGKIILSENFDSELNILKSYLTGQNLYINILGPKSQSDSDDWNDQMYDLADRHTNAFESGNLESSIKTVLDKYGFDGVVFDYEFPLRSKDWKAYDKFIVSLNSVLGDEYKIGMSMVGWNLKQSEEAMNATDFFEIMSYDLWDKEGNHATLEIAKDDIDKFVKNGYDKAQLDLGLPFYARPTTQEAYWYDYKTYYDKIDENGLFSDSETGLTFSFNTYDVIKEKTEYALDNGLGGVMVWHYSCDLPKDNEKSLFGAIYSAKESKINEANEKNS